MAFKPTHDETDSPHYLNQRRYDLIPTLLRVLFFLSICILSSGSQITLFFRKHLFFRERLVFCFSTETDTTAFLTICGSFICIDVTH